MVLVLRALGLGDLLTAVPALRGLRRAFPAHHLVLAAPRWLAPLAEPHVDEVLGHTDLDTPLPSRIGPDIAVNLHGRGPRSHALLDSVGPAHRIGHAAAGWAGPPWYDGIAERRRWCDLMSWYGIPADPADIRLPPPAEASPLPGAVVVHPGAGYRAKQWPATRFAEVARALAAEGHPVAVTGSAAEHEPAAEVVARAGLPPEALLAGRTGLSLLAALVQQATVVVSGDTGIAHLAAAYGTASVVLYGPVPARRWGPPPGGPQLALCSIEHPSGDPLATEPDPALLAVTVAEVLSAVRRLVG